MDGPSKEEDASECAWDNGRMKFSAIFWKLCLRCCGVALVHPGRLVGVMYLKGQLWPSHFLHVVWGLLFRAAPLLIMVPRGQRWGKPL